jgi:deazaflavin-dependent oxidoreductase (nitroreductase family)
MTPEIQRALAQPQTIDITTTGRQSGEPRRIEIVFFNFGGRIYISGMPRADRERAWISNLRADNRMTFHLKGSVAADLPASARVIDDPAERRRILDQIAVVWRRDPEPMYLHSPLIEVSIEGYAPALAA